MLKNAIRAAAVVLVLFFASHTSFAQNPGGDLFKAKCQACHGADGLATSSMSKALGVRSYDAPDVLKLSNTDLTTIIKNGKNKMPAFATQLTDPQIKDLIAYIHTLQGKK